MEPTCDATEFLHVKISGRHDGSWCSLHVHCHLQSGHVGPHEAVIMAEGDTAHTFKWD